MNNNIAMGAKPDDNMITQLPGGKAKLQRLGDCREMSSIDESILDARKVVQTL